MRFQLLFILLFVSCFSHIYAEVKLPSILANHMVLQQKTKIKLWGWSNANTILKISTSWNNKMYQVQANSKGQWGLWVDTSNAGGPYSIIFDDGDITELTDIYIGEVWLCSGQSNMEMPMKGYVGQPVENSTEVISNALSTIPIRFFTVKRNAAKIVQENCLGTWSLNAPENVADFSATAYFFALQLYKTLQVPIGLVNSSWSGSAIQAWMTSESLKSYPEISQRHLFDQSEVKKPHFQASMLYNGMVYPIQNYVFKGLIWYQGESNIENSTLYESLFCTFVKDWRVQFSNDKMPVYYVQIAPYSYENRNATNSALLRQAQYNCEKLIPNVGMAVIMDIGNELCIHPAKKEQVGNRLAYLALSQTYGVKGISAVSPRCSSCNVREGRIVLSFERAPLGLTSFGYPLQYFEISGKDGIYYSAQACIVNGKQVEVWSDKVRKPVSVRYAFKNFVKGDLFGVNGLPVSSFSISL